MPAEEFGEGAFRAIADELMDEFFVGCVHLTGQLPPRRKSHNVSSNSRPQPT
jgi:hypothetical protein